MATTPQAMRTSSHLKLATARVVASMVMAALCQRNKGSLLVRSGLPVPQNPSNYTTSAVSGLTFVRSTTMFDHEDNVKYNPFWAANDDSMLQVCTKNAVHAHPDLMPVSRAPRFATSHPLSPTTSALRPT